MCMVGNLEDAEKHEVENKNIPSARNRKPNSHFFQFSLNINIYKLICSKCKIDRIIFFN